MKTPYEMFGVECNAGWKALYQPLIDLCALYDVQVMQVKEKFGGLRFYVMGARQDELAMLISAAEAASFHTCEDCGVFGVCGWEPDANQVYKRIYRVTTGTSETSGWVRSLCPECREKWDASRRPKPLTT